MSNFMRSILVVFVMASCSNTSELETGEIKTLRLLKDAVSKKNSSNAFIDSRNLLSRKQIDDAAIPILFVELDTGQNGTLTPYPGQGIGQTWLGADGATITLERGILKASRGMGDDLMGSVLSMRPWAEIEHSEETYLRTVSYLSGNNKIYMHSLTCSMKKNDEIETVKIWDVTFFVKKYKENCVNEGNLVTNTYYLDDRGVVRKSRQYHSKKIGYIITERLDR